MRVEQEMQPQQVSPFMGFDYLSTAPGCPDHYLGIAVYDGQGDNPRRRAVQLELLESTSLLSSTFLPSDELALSLGSIEGKYFAFLMEAEQTHRVVIYQLTACGTYQKISDVSVVLPPATLERKRTDFLLTRTDQILTVRFVDIAENRVLELELNLEENEEPPNLRTHPIQYTSTN